MALACLDSHTGYRGVELIDEESANAQHRIEVDAATLD